MKSKFWTLLVIIILSCVLCGVLSGCSQLSEGVNFLTFSVDGTDVHGSVSNATRFFNLHDEIKVKGNALYKITLDKGGKHELETNVITLEEGDNVVYVTEYLDDKTTVYTVNIRRKLVYTVKFVAKDTEIGSVLVEEGDFIEKAPVIPDVLGYEEHGYDFDFYQPILSDQTIYVNMTPRENTPYKVEHYFENIEDNGYTLGKSFTLYAKTDSEVSAEPIEEEGFVTQDEEKTDIVLADGSLVFKFYYTRKKYLVKVDFQGGTATYGLNRYLVKHGQSVKPPTLVRYGHTFDSFDKSFENITESMTITASWIPERYDLVFDYCYAGQDLFKTSVVYGEEFTLPEHVERGGYDFEGWYCNNRKLEDGVWTLDIAGGTGIVTAKFQSIFTCNGSNITGLTTYGKNLEKLEIPAEIDGVYITGIKSYAFCNLENLTEVTFSQFSRVKTIEKYAFNICSNITDIKLPSSLEEVYSLSFYGCEKLKYYSVNGAKYLGNSLNPYLALISVPYSQDIKVNSTTKVIASNGLSGIYGTMTIPVSVKYIGSDNVRSGVKINYLGTFSQWRMVVKSANMLSSTPATLVCTDKTVTLS